jgi:hypothetical protein
VGQLAWAAAKAAAGVLAPLQKLHNVGNCNLRIVQGNELWCLFISTRWCAAYLQVASSTTLLELTGRNT